MMRNESAVLSTLQNAPQPQLGAWFDPARDDAPPERLAYFAPMHYERRYAYPLIVWLHDQKGSERDLSRLMPHVSTRNYVAVAVGDSDRDRPWGQTRDAIAETGARVDLAIESAGERFNVHPDRVFLAGVGPGGAMALRIALGRPTAYAGVASFDAGLPRGGRPFGQLKSVRSLPMLLAVNRDSPRYGAGEVSHDLRLLHSAGCTLDIRQYPDDGPVNTMMLADFDSWMMKLVCGQSPAPSKRGATLA
ncbi:hypothetical protein Pla175_17440 [Pirellulimonas nuda]|uniref:Esterase n=1 Tax=Pirellulimonas nuda TaxID=2528009 RepID=A0A518DA63_9BACT|nr:hypothetical protein [Pirellulimonas nuda]QDU88369.1 hypothetical protein Pla175_17440 [Pirellulimonas nuda]